MKKSSVITFFKSVEAVTKALGISQVAVSKWPEIIPKMRALELDKLTNGKLKYDPALYIKNDN